MSRILVPIDGSECANRALDKALEIARLDGSDLVLLYVIDKHKLKYLSDNISGGWIN